MPFTPKTSKAALGGPGREPRRHVIIDPEGRTYRNLNRALEMDFWLLNRWKAKNALGRQVVIESA
jgi:hypothetical protein